MEVNKIISHALQSMPPSKRQKAFAKDTSKLIHMGLNENNYGMSPKAVAALEDSMAGSHFYPDFAAVLLKQKVAEQYGLKAENVLTGAGSSAMIDMIGLTFLDDGDEVLFSAPTYGAFADMAYLNGGGDKVNPEVAKSYRDYRDYKIDFVKMLCVIASPRYRQFALALIASYHAHRCG